MFSKKRSVTTRNIKITGFFVSLLSCFSEKKIIYFYFTEILQCLERVGREGVIVQNSDTYRVFCGIFWSFCYMFKGLRYRTYQGPKNNSKYISYFIYSNHLAKNEFYALFCYENIYVENKVIIYSIIIESE